MPPKLKSAKPQAQLLPHNQLFGKFGEKQASEFLTQKGFQILHTNFQIKGGELDIVAFDPVEKIMVFVEVKTRGSQEFGHPTKAVNSKKTRNLKRTALYYLDRFQLEYEYRFDIISISPSGLEHFENITLFRRNTKKFTF